MTDQAHHQIRINGDRLLQRMADMAQIGATPKGGVNRVALSDEDKIGRDLFVQWCRELGCTIQVDQMGNIFARRAGKNNDLPPIMMGSHLDSQPTGGKFDGVYGVLAGLEVLETLNDNAIITEPPLELVSWTNEEGARFTPAMIGSGVFAGEFSLEYGLGRLDKAGLSLGQELQRIGYAGDVPMGGRPIQAAFELHIEQGPILEIENKTIGVVTGVQGIRWYHLILEGKEAHAGTTPMERRHDPVATALPILSQIYELATQYAPDARVTIGDLRAEPGVINTVPGTLTITVDIRHPDATTLGKMDTALTAIVQDAANKSAVPCRLEAIWYSPPINFAPDCIDAIQFGVDVTGAAAMNIVSGAGHDAVYLSKVAPTAMIFIPCEDGLSHNELENVEPEHLIIGCNVLLQAVLKSAGY